MFLSHWRQQRREKRAIELGRAFVAVAWDVPPETLTDEDVLNAWSDAMGVFQAAREAALPTFEQAASALADIMPIAQRAWEEAQADANQS